ncbi:MAG: ABC transporter permease [Bacteroidota bacterium]
MKRPSIQKKQSGRVNLIFIASFISLIGLWMLATTLKWVDPLFLPSLGEIGHRALFLSNEGGFFGDIAISVGRVMLAFTISALIAVPLAAFMSEFRWLNRLIEPYIDFIRYLPVPALIPLSILIFGIGEEAKIALLFTGTFFQLILLILDDLKQIPSTYLDLAYTLKYGRGKLLHLKLASIAPQIYNNCRITLGWCWTYLVIAELVASQAGIGHMIKEAQRFSNTADVFVGIMVMGIIGFASDNILKFFYPRIFKYQ